MWADIPYMQKNEDFTIDDGGEGAWKGLTEYVTELKIDGRQFVPILDAAIGPADGIYWPLGVAEGAFLKNPDGTIYAARVWPTEASFPDFTKDAGKNIWIKGLNDLYNTLKFDGLWLDMNEPVVFDPLPTPDPEVSS
jgi:alpha-glucosidase